MTPPESESGRDLTSLRNRFFQLALETMETLLATTNDAPSSSQESPVMLPPRPPPHPGWRWLSPTERQIVEFLLRNGPSIARQISRGIGHGNEPTSRLRELLPNLVERQILGRSQEGYFVVWPTDAEPGAGLPQEPGDEE